MCAWIVREGGGETSSYSENWMHVFRIRPRELAYLGNPSFQTSLLYQPTFFSTETWSLNFFCELALISKPTLWQLINFRAKCLDHFFFGTAHAYRVSSWMICQRNQISSSAQDKDQFLLPSRNTIVLNQVLETWLISDLQTFIYDPT